jgi:hypothetical protein
VTAEIPIKRKRGGQPGNRNAKHNRGNRTSNRHRFAPGNRLGSAPLGNQNAHRQPKAPHFVLLEEYKHQPEATAWIEDHAKELDEAHFTADEHHDRATFFAYMGLTLDAFLESGREYEHRLYSLTEEVDFEDSEELAA